MISINTSSLTKSVFTVGLKNDPSTKSDTASASVNLRGNVYTEPGQKSGEAQKPLSPHELLLKQLQDQIKQTQAIIQQLQQQLAMAQASKAPAEEKAAQVMAVQQQIADTMVQLGSQQAALIKVMTGNLHTTA